MKPGYAIVQTQDRQLPWQIHSSTRNENAEFADLGIAPDYYLAGFSTREAAEWYVTNCMG